MNKGWKWSSALYKNNASISMAWRHYTPGLLPRQVEVTIGTKTVELLFHTWSDPVC